jgi:hypothetical protein
MPQFPVIAIVSSGIACLVFTLSLFVGAFTTITIPETNASADIGCIASTASSETTHTIMMFALGYLCCLAAKRRHDLARQTHRLSQLAVDAAASVCSAVTSMVSASVSALTEVRPRSMGLQQPAWLNKRVMSITIVAMLCTSCILFLFISAFAANTNIEGTATDESATADMSPTMRVFTVGWILLFSFKLQRELVLELGDALQWFAFF